MDLSIRTLANQLDALLDISKLDAGVIPVNKSSVRLDNLVQRLCDELVSTADEKNLKLFCHCDEECFVYTDEILLERVLRNIIGNAIKYTQHGEVNVAVTNQTGQYLIQIMDTGPGIPVNEQQTVFEEFYQLENPERDRSKGLGLGLAIVKRLTDLLELELSLRSNEGEGSCFEIIITKENTTASEIQSTIRRDKKDWSQLNVLVIDNEKQVRNAMQELLTATGCQVITSDSGQNAIELCQSTRPNLLLVDYQLAENENGLDVIRSIRQDYPDMPAIIISGGITQDAREQVMQHHIELLTKPVSAQTLQDAISRNC